MLDARRQSIVIAVFTGLGVGSLGWLLLGSTSLGKRLEVLEALSSQTAALPRAISSDAQSSQTARTMPLFRRAQSNAAPATVRVDGIAMRPGGRSALLAIGGGEARWLKQGDTSGGLTISQVRSGEVVIETADGSFNIMLGQTFSPEAILSAAAKPSQKP